MKAAAGAEIGDGFLTVGKYALLSLPGYLE
jgi:hypothetical protein